MTTQKDIDCAIRLFEKYMKNKRPEKPKEKVIFMRNIPFVVSENAYIKYFRVEVLWLNPELMVNAIKSQVTNYERKPRPRMYC